MHANLQELLGTRLDHQTSPSLSLHLPHKMKVNSANVDCTIINITVEISYMFQQMLGVSGTSFVLQGWLVLSIMVCTCDNQTNHSDITKTFQIWTVLAKYTHSYSCCYIFVLYVLPVGTAVGCMPLVFLSV